MLKDPSKKYRPFPPVNLSNRQWPNRTLTHAPRWCSVDLRDGNQALAVPMNVSQKLELFHTLVKCGFKEIEVGFPSASNTEFTFNRRLIEEKRAPDDVWLQVLVQAREDLIERTVESLIGAKKAIIHLYNSTSPAQRRVVFGKTKDEIKAIAVNGAKLIKDRLPRLAGTEIMLQYSPESFSATEVEFAKEISEAVMDVWQPTPQRKMILNLPDTVEVAMPNVYADQIEWICRNIKQRDSLIISLHTHNDRSTGVAATELGLLAGADRVEGTLFGNGERTGNLDLVNVAMNLFATGVDPQLDITDIDRLRRTAEYANRLEVHPRHPYAGDLVYTSFSGSHQDAIKKGFAALPDDYDTWAVPYLPIDPHHVGRTYEAVIRVNSQSGKGGVAYVMSEERGLDLPRRMQVEFSKTIQNITEDSGTEIDPATMWAAFRHEYLPESPEFELVGHELHTKEGLTKVTAQVRRNGSHHTVVGEGSGPIGALVLGLRSEFDVDLDVVDYEEHAIGAGSDATAAAYVESIGHSGRPRWGIGLDPNITTASFKAVLGALERQLR